MTTTGDDKLALHSLKDPSGDQIRQIIKLYRDAGWWTEAVDNPDLVRRIVAGSHCFIIAVTAEKIIGMGRAISDGASDAYIQDVTVAASHRNRGIGSAIIKDLVARLEKDGLTWIGLIAERGTQALYRACGFTRMQDSTPMLKSKT